MNKDITLKEKSSLVMQDMQDTQKMCQMLLQSPHYKKMGAEGIFAIVEKARSIGLSPTAALNGGMYYVQGKVEMSATTMNELIRGGKFKHSISKDRKSDDTICILHGKRADNGDTWTESFSIEDAKKAGIYRNQWIKYPRDMLFARALSRLARQLFPDVIHGCYVTGEISDAPPINEPVEVVRTEGTKATEVLDVTVITKEETEHLDKMIGDDAFYRRCVMSFIEKQFGLKTLEGMPRHIFEKIIPIATAKFEKREAEAREFVYGEEQQMAMEG